VGGQFWGTRFGVRREGMWADGFVVEAGAVSLLGGLVAERRRGRWEGSLRVCSVVC
jgi:hypothetical protein